MRIGERGSEDRRKIRRSNGCSIQHQIQISFRSEIKKDDPVPRCYQIQKMLQIRLKMFDVEDDIPYNGSILKMIQKMFDVEHDVPDLKDPPDP
ncbi:hypothetical protein HanIR_Chr03g0103131 [Helianthus annuus]|nr:hypothetical protein HanIR_Chr03g0103131 [Helianthus annuus]